MTGDAAGMLSDFPLFLLIIITTVSIMVIYDVITRRKTNPASISIAAAAIILIGIAAVMITRIVLAMFSLEEFLSAIS